MLCIHYIFTPFFSTPCPQPLPLPLVLTLCTNPLSSLLVLTPYPQVLSSPLILTPYSHHLSFTPCPHLFSLSLPLVLNPSGFILFTLPLVITLCPQTMSSPLVLTHGLQPFFLREAVPQKKLKF